MTTEIKNLIYTTSVFGMITLGSIFSYDGIPGRKKNKRQDFVAPQGGANSGVAGGVDRTTQNTGTGSGGQATQSGKAVIGTGSDKQSGEERSGAKKSGTEHSVKSERDSIQ